MDLAQFKRRIEDEYDRYAPPGTPVHVTVLGPAALGGWHLQANLWSATRECRVLNITEEDGAVVRGVLYEISAALVTRCDGRRSVVDRLEGHRTTVHPENYAKVCITVDLDGEPRTAWTYLGLREAIARCEREHPGTGCSGEYAQAVLDGAESIGLPDDYRALLRSVLLLDAA